MPRKPKKSRADKLWPSREAIATATIDHAEGHAIHRRVVENVRESERRLPRCGTTHVPEGQKAMWTCTRGLGHEGPCAAVPTMIARPFMRSEGERLRLLEQLDRLDSMVASARACIARELPGYLLGETNAIAEAALRLATTAARHDAYALAEEDRRG